MMVMWGSFKLSSAGGLADILGDKSSCRRDVNYLLFNQANGFDISVVYCVDSVSKMKKYKCH